MQDNWVKKWKTVVDPYTIPKTRGEEESGSQGMEENKDGWEEVQMPIPPLVVPKYVPKLPFLQRQQRNKLN